MKKKFLIFTLCFTLVFSSFNYRKSYADGGIISLPILATVSSVAVATGIVIKHNDDLYDLAYLFYDYVAKNNEITWDVLVTTFHSSVAVLSNGLVSVDSKFLNILKDFFDSTFGITNSDLGYSGVVPFEPATLHLPLSLFNSSTYFETSTYGTYLGTTGDIYLLLENSYGALYASFYYINDLGKYYPFGMSYNVGSHLNDTYVSIVEGNKFKFENGSKVTYSSAFTSLSSIAFPYQGGYSWDNLKDKIENNDLPLPIPGNLGNLVGQTSKDFWDNTDDFVGNGDLSLPYVDNPSIGLDGTTSFPNSGVDADDGVSSPSVPSEGIWSTVKDFIIGLVVPSDAFWTDTWGGLYNNFTDSFPIVDMDGFNDLVTGEKKFPNIDINIMGVNGRVVNGDVINSIVDWLRPIIAGFMMICLMLFNYRKIYKLIRNTEPFGGIAPGTSDFKTGISEYTHVGLVNDGFKRSEEEEFARSRYYEEMHFRNGGKL